MKAVHIEAVSDLTSEAFLACLRRFISHRGKPVLLWSYHGSNSIGAKRILKKLYEFMHKETPMKPYPTSAIMRLLLNVMYPLIVKWLDLLFASLCCCRLLLLLSLLCMSLPAYVYVYVSSHSVLVGTHTHHISILLCVIRTSHIKNLIKINDSPLSSLYPATSTGEIT